MNICTWTCAPRSDITVTLSQSQWQADHILRAENQMLIKIMYKHHHTPMYPVNHDEMVKKQTAGRFSTQCQRVLL